MSDETFSSVFAGKQSQLEDMIDIDDTSLLTKLVDYEVITTRHRQAIDAMKVTFNNFKLNLVLFSLIEI